ncbi:MAG: sensor histidine kinase [Bacteroidota bacterium]
MEKYLYTNIVKFILHNEMDIVLAHKRARQLSDMTGIGTAAHTKFTTAISEICRNVLEYVGEGTISFNLVEEDGKLCLEAIVADRGRGIGNLEELLSRTVPLSREKGNGIFHARKLVDTFLIESNSEKGTRVLLRKKLPMTHLPINATIVKGWQEFFIREHTVSPYEELKRQSMETLDILESLRMKNIQTELQLDEIKSLNHEVTGLLAERQERNELLQKMNLELEDFAHTVSHDLKAPLYNMEAICTRMAKIFLKPENEAQLFLFEMLKSQITRMDKLITGILSYSKSGRQQVEKQRVDVAALVAEVIASLVVPQGFEVQTITPMPTLMAEEIYLQQIFSNFISNAIKYHDRLTGTIQISCQQAGAFYQFSVSDDGPGILPQFQKKIFKIFYSINPSANTNSTGLGLSIIRRITEEKGGSAWVDSQGRGSTFHFTWPKG